jgi:hypothetical protein
MMAGWSDETCRLACVIWLAVLMCAIAGHAGIAYGRMVEREEQTRVVRPVQADEVSR